MKTVHHRLPADTPGTRTELVSLHFGTPGRGPKAAIQASLHADEVPAMLVAHHLRERLAALEADGRVLGEVVLVPAANPLGLSQRLLHGPVGRFHLGSGENFNRHYADLVDTVAAAVQGRLGAEADANVALVRAAMRDAVAALPSRNALQGLRNVLLGLAIDADLVLDLHTDQEAVVHLYTATPVWPRVRALSCLLGAQVALLATESGDHPFDEACSMPWPALAARLGMAEGAAGATPLPPACVAVTVELRGEADVSHELAARDAQAILDWLATEGVLAAPTAALPEALCEATPLAGSMPVAAPHGGILVWCRHPGDRVAAGEVLADVVDPLSGLTSPLASPVDGLLYARESRRFAVAGASVCKVAGQQPLRLGKLLSA